MKLLDKDGLSYFWAKLKTLLNGKLDADAVSSTGTESTGWNNCRLSGGKIQYYNTNTTYSSATTSSAGLMSASDKTKLNGIETGATKTTVDTALSSTSTNPVQNKAVQAPVARLVDAGTKNIFDISTLKSSGSLASGSFTNNGVTYTLNSDGTVSLSGTATSNSTCSFVLFNANSPYLAKFAGKELSGGLSARVYLAIEMASSPYTLLALSQSGAGKIGVPDSTKQYLFYIRVMSGENVNGKIISPMICTAEEYAISLEFVPYAPSNRELYEMILALQNAQNGG